MLTPLDAIFAQYEIVLPHTKKIIDTYQEEAIAIFNEKGTDHLFNLQNNHDYLNYFKIEKILKINSTCTPSEALEDAIANCQKDAFRTSLIHYLTLRLFFFSEEEGDDRFNVIFSSSGSQPLTISTSPPLFFTNRQVKLIIGFPLLPNCFLFKRYLYLSIN